MPRYFWFNILLLFFPCSLLTQTVVEPEWLTIEDGLSQGFVSCIIQDREGFLWMGTKNGLNRYDGKHFQVFTHDPYDSYSISDDFIHSLYEFGDFILVGTENEGLNLFYKKTKRFYKIILNKELAGAQKSFNIKNIFKDSLGQFWVRDELSGHIYRIRFQENFWTLFPDNERLLKEVNVQKIQIPDDIIITNFLDYKDDILVVSDDLVVWYLEPKTGAIKKFDRQPPIDICDIEISFQKSINLVYACCEDRILLLKDGNWRVVSTDFLAVRLDYLPEKQQYLIESTGKSLLFEKNALDRPAISQKDALFVIPEQKSPYFNLFNDRSGIIWAGSSGFGAMKFSPRSFKIKTYFEGTSINAVPFLSTEKEIITSNLFNDFYTLGDQSRLNELIFSSKRIHRIVEDNSSNIWIITHQNPTYFTILKLSEDGTVEEKQRFPTPLHHYHWHVVSYVVEDNAILIATRESLIRYQIDEDQLHIFDFQNLIIGNYATHAVAKTKNGHYWIGTNRGLVHAVPDGQGFRFELISKEGEGKNGLRTNEVASLLEDPEDDNILWIGTKGGGLHRLDIRDMSFSYISTRNGLPNDVIYGVLNDDHGNLWMSSNKGIIRYNPTTGVVKNFTKADGMQSNEFNTATYYKVPDGTMCFGGINGLNIFHPDDLQDNPVTPRVWITGLMVNNEKTTIGDSTAILSQAIEYTSELVLSFTQNNITLEFAALEYSAPEKNRFRYYLEGAEGPWIHESAENTAPYLNLSPGNYTFHIKAANGDGIWGDEVKRLKITILPPWYRSNPAYFVYAILLGFAIWRILKYRESRIRMSYDIEMERQKTERLEELDTMKSRFFTNISHEFRTPLTIISGMTERMKDDPEKWLVKGHRMIKRNSDNLLNLVNQILDLRKLESNKLELDQIHGDITSHIKYITESFQSFFESKGIQLHFQAEEGVWMDYDPEKIHRIISNLLSNAIKFTPEGGDIFVKVEKDTSSHPSLLLIQVKDSGFGIPEDKLPYIFERFYQVDDSSTRKGEGTGIGLALTHELVKLMKGEIKVESGLNKGSTFFIKLPIFQNIDIKAEKEQPIKQYNDIPILIDHNLETINSVNIPPNETLPSLLIVEDNSDVMQYLIACLEDQFRLITAMDGQEGIDKAIEQVPDIIISDVMMPRKDGFELCNTLKTDERTSHIPIVLLTAKADSESRISGLERGADDYLTKPFNKKELFIRMNNLLGIRKKLQQRYSSLETLPPDQKIEIQQEDEFITKVRNAIEANLDDEAFGIPELCKAVAMSRTQLHRKIKALTSRSTSLYIRSIRLQKAKHLLKTTDLNISRVAYEVGYPDPNYFTYAFSEEFGFPPSKIRK